MDYFALAAVFHKERQQHNDTAYYREQWYQFRTMDRLERQLSLTKNRLGFARQTADPKRVEART
jgi:hypothetical protein